MVDLDVLDQMGSTQERLKQIFTATPKSTPAEREMLQEEVMKRIDGDCKLRDAFESDINKRFSEQVNYSLRNCQMYGAVDLAWDAPPINKATYPLLLYAQGRLDLGKCQKALEGLPDEHKYVTKKPDGTITGINIPKFFECNFNFVRSVITRRLAAQTNKYRALFPYYKYEPRSTSQVGKLRADVFSQVTDIMADGFNYRHHDEQVMRDAMLYGHSLDFVRSAWEVENRTVFEPGQNPDLIPQGGKRKLTTVITKEGLGFINPHPTRIFWDNMYPLSEINTDTGPKFCGFWDVWRYGDVAKNPKYWNRTTIQWSSTVVQLFSTYAQYFSQYYCTINDHGFLGAEVQAHRDITAASYSAQSTPSSRAIWRSMLVAKKCSLRYGARGSSPGSPSLSISTDWLNAILTSILPSPARAASNRLSKSSTSSVVMPRSSQSDTSTSSWRATSKAYLSLPMSDTRIRSVPSGSRRQSPTVSYCWSWWGIVSMMIFMPPL